MFIELKKIDEANPYAKSVERRAMEKSG